MLGFLTALDLATLLGLGLASDSLSERLLLLFLATFVVPTAVAFLGPRGEPRSHERSARSRTTAARFVPIGSGIVLGALPLLAVLFNREFGPLRTLAILIGLLAPAIPWGLGRTFDSLRGPGQALASAMLTTFLVGLPILGIDLIVNQSP